MEIEIEPGKKVVWKEGFNPVSLLSVWEWDVRAEIALWFCINGLKAREELVYLVVWSVWSIWSFGLSGHLVIWSVWSVWSIWSIWSFGLYGR